MEVYSEETYLDLLACEEDLRAYEESGQAEADREAAEEAAFLAMVEAAEQERLSRAWAARAHRGYVTEQEFAAAFAA